MKRGKEMEILEANGVLSWIKKNPVPDERKYTQADFKSCLVNASDASSSESETSSSEESPLRRITVPLHSKDGLTPRQVIVHNHSPPIRDVDGLLGSIATGSAINQFSQVPSRRTRKSHSPMKPTLRSPGSDSDFNSHTGKGWYSAIGSFTEDKSYKIDTLRQQLDCVRHLIDQKRAVEEKFLLNIMLYSGEEAISQTPTSRYSSLRVDLRVQ
ncbi:hypothetical protein M011DRAFT_326237 [Sporormia fimetaria CBS 119925]|uniref:Uncharacterized protein n=1 Tax=Sporormia fimetaria CBS 119925 TaxID=1340428 RepID=A0A6A6VH52_9PLEO|nr:hypothetical protein M011DRAFT_326237 [Sporormia fimetaria CBS 119925]